MDLLSSYDDETSNTSNRSATEQISMKSGSAGLLQSEWEHFEKMIGSESVRDKKDAVKEVQTPSAEKVLENPMPSNLSEKKDKEEEEEDESHLPPGVRKKNRCHSSSSSSSENESSNSDMSTDSDDSETESKPNKESKTESRDKPEVKKDLKQDSQEKTTEKRVKNRSVSRSRSRSPHSKRRRSSERSRHSRSRSRSRHRSRSKHHRKEKKHRSHRSRSKDRRGSKDRDYYRSKHRERDRHGKRRDFRNRRDSERSRRSRSRSKDDHDRNHRSRSRENSEHRRRSRSGSRSRRRNPSPRGGKVIKYGEKVIKAGASFGRPPPSKPMTFKEKMRQQLIKAIEEGGDVTAALLNTDGTVICTQTAGTQQVPAPKKPPVPLMANLITNAAGIAAATITASEAAMQSLIELQKQTTEKTGVEIPKYYNPAAINPVKYAEQVQKRKLLWSKTKEKEVNSQWHATTLSSDHDDKSKEKFRKLMGIKQEDSGLAEDEEELEQKQKELFEKLDKEYQFARMATHTHRGVGLGFGSSSYPPPGT
ncbi:arginine/serine-rich coiled-coil protein 2-like isoform X1 [Biomphalaria pfeifferi]|uniref:Arginine/serine-rich coiled-coil protein 2-like isoform X1 n=1 Tax=Biomphalaria pfeifferi TaxID=112525 RepID=A0AAD8BTX8_BIOPF|nr:arginine/serine-rich coiled-coil protein 2-like isoform X1 [Biomphalaria pfeifferi]